MNWVNFVGDTYNVLTKIVTVIIQKVGADNNSTNSIVYVNLPVITCKLKGLYITLLS